MTRRLAPSILSADFACLGEGVAAAERGGATLVHVDVMDGRFVPNITIGPVVVKSLRAATKLPLDCHLMIAEPERYIDDFIDAGADMVSFHIEATPHAHRALQQIRDKGAKAGLVLNPGTALANAVECLPYLDFVLLMSVNPGFGGQSFIPHVADKAKSLSQMRQDMGLDFAIEIDGGVGPKNIVELAQCGVDWFVAGSAVFKGDAEANSRQLCDLLAGVE